MGPGPEGTRVHEAREGRAAPGREERVPRKQRTPSQTHRHQLTEATVEQPAWRLGMPVLFKNRREVDGSCRRAGSKGASKTAGAGGKAPGPMERQGLHQRRRRRISEVAAHQAWGSTGKEAVC